MPETLITRTFAEGLRPLGPASQRNPALIIETVRSHLSPAHVMLFCEPSPKPDGVTTDWYAQCAGAVRQLDNLDEDEASAVRSRLGQLVEDILGLADRLEEAGGDSARAGAQALRHGVEVPASDAIWLVGDQPVLVNWGYTLDVDLAPRGIIRRLIPPRSPPRQPSPPSGRSNPLPRPPQPCGPAGDVAPERRLPWSAVGVLWWLGWLCLAGLVLLVFSLLVAPCALVLPGVGTIDMCPSASSTVLAREREAVDTLENRVAMLERELAMLDGSCQQRHGDVTDVVVSEGATLGALNILLSWQGSADLDLSVTCPSGAILNYRDRNACGGKLDVDANAPVSPMKAPVENIVFEHTPDDGLYTVGVHPHRNRQDDREAPQHLVLTVIVDGEEALHSGTVDGDNRPWRTDVLIGGDE